MRRDVLMNRGFEKWFECIDATCEECDERYEGRQFGAIRLGIKQKNGNDDCVPGPEVFIVELKDLDKISTKGQYQRLSLLQKHDPFMQARWVVENYKLAYSGPRGTKHARKPIQGEQFKVVYLSAISHCRCKLMEEAKLGNLSGPRGDACIPVNDMESTTSDGEGPADQASYFQNKKLTIESFANSALAEGGKSAAGVPSKDKRAKIAAVTLQQLTDLVKPGNSKTSAAKTTKRPFVISPMKPNPGGKAGNNHCETGQINNTRADNVDSPKESTNQSPTIQSTIQSPATAVEDGVFRRPSDRVTPTSSNTTPRAPLRLSATSPTVPHHPSRAPSPAPRMNRPSPVPRANRPPSSPAPAPRTSRPPSPASESSSALSYSSHLSSDEDDEIIEDDIRFSRTSPVPPILSRGTWVGRNVDIDELATAAKDISGESVMTSTIGGEENRQLVSSAWETITAGPERDRFNNQLKKLCDSRDALERMDRKNDVCGEIGIEAVRKVEDLLHKLERIDGIPQSICLAANSAVTAMVDYSKAASIRLTLLQKEVTAAYRVRDLYNMRRLAQRKVLLIIRSLLSHERTDALLEMDFSLLNEDIDGACHESFALDFAETLGRSDFDLEQGCKDLQKASRGKILENAGFPTKLVLRAKYYRGPCGHMIPNAAAIMEEAPNGKERLPFFFHYTDPATNKVYVPGSKQAWCAKEHYDELLDRFNDIRLQTNRDAMIAECTEYCRHFLKIWMPDPVDQWNAYVGFPNPYVRVVLEVFQNSLHFFGSLANHTRAKDGKKPDDFTFAFRAATAKLSRMFSEIRRAALYGSKKISTEDGAAKYRWDFSIVPKCPLNIIEYANDPEKNAKNEFLQCFWTTPPERYVELARLLPKANRGGKANNDGEDIIDGDENLEEDQCSIVSREEYASTFACSTRNDLSRLGELDVTTASEDDATPRVYRKRTRPTKRPTTNVLSKKIRCSDDDAGTSPSIMEEFSFTLGKKLYTDEDEAKEAVKSFLRTEFPELDDKSVNNGADKVVNKVCTLKYLIDKVNGDTTDA